MPLASNPPMPRSRSRLPVPVRLHLVRLRLAAHLHILALHLRGLASYARYAQILPLRARSMILRARLYRLEQRARTRREAPGGRRRRG